jgi:uncharacterized protein (DUF983 family)
MIIPDWAPNKPVSTTKSGDTIGMNLPCPHCGMTRDMSSVNRIEQVTIKGREVSFLAHFSRCLTCGNDIETSEQFDANLDAAMETWKKYYGSKE